MTFIDHKSQQEAGIAAMSFWNEKYEFQHNTIPEIEKEYNVKVLLAYVRGSHMYGTNLPTSDVDVLFIYQQPTDSVLRGDYLEQINYGGNDIVGYEIQRYIELLSANNPNIIESLDIPDDCIIYRDEKMKMFNQKDWLTKKTRDSILGYANSQIKKATGLNKNMNNPQPKERKGILEFCYIIDKEKSIPFLKWYENYKVKFSYLDPEFLDHNNWGLVNVPVGKGLFTLYLNELSNDNFRGLIIDEDSVNLRLSSIPKERIETRTEVFNLYYNLDGFQTHCKDWANYWKWEKERNEDRFKMNQKAGQGVDLKNMMHLFRLLDMCENISLGNGIKVRSENVNYLLDIRKGKYNYEDLLEQSDRRFAAIKHNFEKVDLPEQIDVEKSKDLLLNFRKNY